MRLKSNHVSQNDDLLLPPTEISFIAQEAASMGWVDGYRIRADGAIDGLTNEREETGPTAG